MFDYLSLEVSKMVGDTINLDFNVSGEFKQDESKYNLVFVLQAASKTSEELDVFLKLKCNALFAFKDVDGIDSIPDYFYRNSIAIVFPYVRAYVSMITQQTNSNKRVILPTMNLSSLGNVLKDETTVVK